MKKDKSDPKVGKEGIAEKQSLPLIQQDLFFAGRDIFLRRIESAHLSCRGL